MTCNFNKKKGIYFFIIFSFLTTTCRYNTVEKIDKTNKRLPNGILLVVEKVNKETTSRGALTNYNYGTTHSFTYKFDISKGRIHWDGGSGEPKNIVFCRDSIYISFLKEKRINTSYIDSINGTTKYHYHYEIREFYQKHIDERYFFKLLGDAYWEDISPESYVKIKRSCLEYSIPNDAELVLKSEIKVES